MDVAIIGQFLEHHPYRLTFAADGVEAWERLSAEPERFDTVILDRMMPRLDGMELLSRLRAERRFDCLPVILQTAANTPDDVAEGLAAGAWYYLGKPYRALALQRIVAGAIEDRLNRRELARLQAELDETWTLLRDGRFRFRTPGQAQLLAARLGNLCPSPSQAALGLSELMINAVEHGNLGIGYRQKTLLLDDGGLALEIQRRLDLPEQQDVWAEIGFWRESGQICFRIEDRGPGFDWSRFLEISPERVFASHGRGIAMARELSFETLEFQGAGNVVLATVRMEPGDAHETTASGVRPQAGSKSG